MYSKIILFILLPIFAFSQAPQKINFQSILRNTNGAVVSDKSVSLKISILSGSISGSIVYTETHTKTTDQSGLISLQIGNGTVLSGVFANIAWGDFPHFIKLEADFSGGNNYVLLGTQELMSVPYALYASKTDTSSLNLVNRFNSKVNITDTSSMLNPYLRKSDSIIADLQLQNKQLQNLSSVVDIDGNSYKTVKIGSQVWMSENLKTSRYRNGSSIPNVVGNADWQALTTGAWSVYNHDALNNAIYGKLYNGFTTLGDTLCPTGWHLPSDADWTTLTIFLGGESVAGGKLKSIGFTYWRSPNSGATNKSGFLALPGGFRYNDGSFSDISSSTFFWSATVSNYDFLRNYMRYLIFSDEDFFRSDHHRSYGFSIRCLKDPDIDINQSLNIKVNIADTSDMLNPYLRKADAIGSVETDPVFNTSVAKGITGIDTAYWNRKLNLSDTSNMLSNYRTRLNNKVNFSDTANMLANYKTIITDLQKQVELLSSYTSLLASGLVDIDGNNYPVVKIGNQIWMKENLRVSRYRNGDVIPIITDNTTWSSLTTGARSWYNNDSSLYEYPYGNLYNWYAASDNRNICPAGWHVPSDADWTVLTNYLGGESVAGGKLKSIGNTFWESPNLDANNESGFSSLPTGIRTENYEREPNNGFGFIGKYAFFWSSNETASCCAYYFQLFSDLSIISKTNNYFGTKKVGVAVRCIKN